jgi:hypothetical protein
MSKVQDPRQLEFIGPNFLRKSVDHSGRPHRRRVRTCAGRWLWAPVLDGQPCQEVLTPPPQSSA